MAVLVGKKAPSFSASAVVNGGEFIDDFSLDQFAGKKYVVFFFYPADFTFVCPTEIIAFHKKIAKFEKAGANVVGVSVDSPFTHLAWKNTPRKEGGLGEIDFPLLADLGKQAAGDYEVLLGDGIAARGVFIIDGEGVLQSYTVNNLGVGRNVNEIIRLIEGFKFVAEHGEVCPADWSPGDDTMKPDPVGSQEYFAKVE